MRYTYNGRQVAVTQYDGYIIVSYFGTGLFLANREYPIEDTTYVVESIQSSPYVKGVTNVKMRAV